MKKRIFAVILALTMALSMTVLLSGCGSEEESADGSGTIILATTTSTKDSGLLDAILPVFEEESGYTVDVVSVGSGEAMTMGENGEADVLLVHSPAAEEEYVAGGHADEDGRMDVMYNDFVIVGPEADPAGVSANAGDDAIAAFGDIMENQATFVSRADESGTHTKELSIWEEAGLTPSGEWYVEAAAGMADVITMADEMSGYTLADRATWLNVGGDTSLTILCEKDPSGVLYNQYGVICVNPDKNENINHEGAKAFQEWIVSDETQSLIGEYGVEEYGEALFVPNAQ
ncbi:MAG TPA: substrate-binding domain-containing protein [Candidatus Copromorpha excrementigallinarum]|uniref:Substrate-binding domain-containing protein n=1 Tax=Candidatus Allocopromorpha excrementigallinarum TaxID=2840742 RepID=A0A9D1I3F1_9FIRM|nr:substrate-binding domain-containing protein [Candidatus Copromorpha excrementigallinarum]